ncbi:hypothetical protein AVI48_16365 (plasmid) [Piscirickettsia salmonis]|nr:hypothetical protein AVI48_16365 [Piscirickettsia salmonis]
MLPFKGLILLKSFTFYHSNSLLTSVDCYTLLKSKFFATVPSVVQQNAKAALRFFQKSNGSTLRETTTC